MRTQIAHLLAVFSLCLLLLAGCESFEMPKWDLFEEKESEQALALPEYEQIAQRYNANLDNLDQLWSRALISVRFVDEAGKTRREQGDGHFIFVLPSKTALSFGKLGRVLFWFGSNESRYWVIDLMNKPSVAYVGETETHGKAALERHGIGITPQEMLRVVGALPLPVDEQTRGSAIIEDFQGDLLVDLPDASLRLLLDPETLRPKRIDLLNQVGESILIARLDKHEPAETQDVPPGGWPIIPTDITLELVGTDGEMRIQLSDPGDGKRFNRIKSGAFEFDRLIRAYRPDDVVELE